MADTEFIGVKVSPELKRAVARYARDHRSSMSELARGLLAGLVSEGAGPSR